MMILTNEDWLAIERELARRSLAEFAKMAWHILEPATDLKWGWALDAVCQHLEAVTHGEITRLLMNVPPGCMKSLLTGVIWPAWEWGPANMPGKRFISTSHKQDLAVRDNMKCRRLIQSQWYQDRWPLTLTGDQNAKTKFENDATGFREAMAFTSMTGSRGDRVVIDDPLSVDDANSEAALLQAERTFLEALPTRVNNSQSAIVVIMQRLHQRDTSGIILDKGLGYTHLRLPMRFEFGNRCETNIGFQDPRSEPDELLFPERFPENDVAELERTLGQYATAGQLQQRPSPRAGGMFPIERFHMLEFAPQKSEIRFSVRYWDKAGTKGGSGAETAGVLMHWMRDGRFVVGHVAHGRWEALDREVHIKTWAMADTHAVQVHVEQEPGSGGKESGQATVRNLAGFTVALDRVTGDKATRAEPYAAQVQAGNVWLAPGEWHRAFLDEHEAFPNGKLKDMVDAASGAFVKLTGDLYDMGALAS